MQQQIHQCLVTVYGYSAPNYCTVTRWFKEFKRDRQSLEDDFSLVVFWRQ